MWIGYWKGKRLVDLFRVCIYIRVQPGVIEGGGREIEVIFRMNLNFSVYQASPPPTLHAPKPI